MSEKKIILAEIQLLLVSFKYKYLEDICYLYRAATAKTLRMGTGNMAYCDM